jgi:selenocysteine lyase/cysteine desulfurase
VPVQATGGTFRIDGVSMPTALDLAFVRAQFPAFEEPAWQGHAFFDNAGGSFACCQVIEHLNRYYRQTKLQPYGSHPLSRRAGEEMDQAHVRLAQWLGVTADEVHFGPSTSQNTYVLAQAFAAHLAPGDEIVVTNQDHEANSGVWRRLASHGLVVKEWRVDSQSGWLDPRQLDRLLSRKTRVVAFTHCSNILGQINPVADICARVHAAGALAVVDGVSFAGHGLPDVPALGADIYLFSLYKTYGPHQGLMVVRTPALERLGNQGHYFNAAHRQKWLTPAGPDHAQIAASGGVGAYFDALHRHHFGEGKVGSGEKAEQVRQLIRASEGALLEPLLDFCRHDRRVRLLGPADVQERAPTVSLRTLTASPLEIATRLAASGIVAGAGNFYAVRLLEAFDIPAEPGVLRFSFVHYTSPEDLRQLLAALESSL